MEKAIPDILLRAAVIKLLQFHVPDAMGRLWLDLPDEPLQITSEWEIGFEHPKEGAVVFSLVKKGPRPTRIIAHCDLELHKHVWAGAPRQSAEPCICRSYTWGEAQDWERE